MIRNFHEWKRCDKFLNHLKNKRNQFIISTGYQKLMVKPEKMEMIKQETKKMSADFLTQYELDLFCNERENDDIKKSIKNDPNFQKWVKKNLIFEEKDLYKNNFLERIFKLPTKNIHYYQSDNILDIYLYKYKNNFLKILLNNSIYNVRECYNDENSLLVPKIDLVMSKKEMCAIETSFSGYTFIIGYDNLMKDYHFRNTYKNFMKKIFFSQFIAKDQNKTYIFLSEENARNMSIIDNGITDILTYPNEMTMNDLFDEIQKEL